MKPLSQISTLQLIADYRKEKDLFNLSTKEVSNRLIESINDNTYTVNNPKSVIAGLQQQRMREESKLSSSTN